MTGQVKAVEDNIVGYLEMNHQLAKEWGDATDKAVDTQKKMADIQDISDKTLERERDKKIQVAQLQDSVANLYSQIIDLNNEMTEMATAIEELGEMYFEEHGKVIELESALCVSQP